jgi:threonine aldolase
MFPIVDLRSDTVTLPPPGMRHAIASAELGDDVYGEDPTVNRLEKIASELLGKESAIFVSSGTMANLLAILAHCSERKRLLVGDQSDIWRWEAGGASVLGGMVYQPIRTQADGELAVRDMEAALYGQEDFQCVPAGLICLEDTHCLAGGTVLSLEYLRQVGEVAKAHDLPLHLDGARLFNAAARLGVEVRRIAQFSESVSICLSKGLAAPVGSLVAGEAGFVRKVRRLRKMIGGGMRQAGVLAAAGIYALEKMVERLHDDHANASRLAEGLSRIPGIEVTTPQPQTNIVFWQLADPMLEANDLIFELNRLGIRVMELGKGKIRAVTHYGVTEQEIDRALQAVPVALARCRSRASSRERPSQDHQEVPPTLCQNSVSSYTTERLPRRYSYDPT